MIGVSSMRDRGSLLALLPVFVVSLFACSSAQAAIVTVGSPLTANFLPGVAGEKGILGINPELGEPGAHVSSPVDGAVIGWKVLGEGGPLELRVVRPEGAGTFLAGAASAPELFMCRKYPSGADFVNCFKQSMTGVQAIGAGCCSLFLKTDGSVWGAGQNAFGGLGDGSYNSRITPEKVFTGVKELSCGWYHSLFLKADGSVWAPQNFEHDVYGQVPMARALAESMNLATIKLGLDLGLPKVADTLQRLGLEKAMK